MSAPLRVVHVIDTLGIGGTENGVVNLTERLDTGFEHSIVCMTQAGPFARRVRAGVDVHLLGKQAGLDGRAIIRLARYFRRRRPRIVHSRNWGAFDAVVAARIARVPVVIHGEHGREVSDPAGRNRRRNILRRLLAPIVDRYVSVSRDLARWLVETVRIPARKVVTIHNGVDIERFADSRRDEGRRLLGLPPEIVAIGTLGRLDPVKDQIGLLEAFAAVAEKHRRVALFVAGDGPCRIDLETGIRHLGLEGRATMLGQRGDIEAFLSGLDLFVLPSIAEGISNTILEAMAAGLPVVATRTGGNPEIVEDGVTGALVAVRDRGGLAEAIATYVGDPHLRALHGKAGQQRATEAFSLDRMAADYAGLYRTLTARDGVRRGA